jgi:hypothetical protein
MGNSRVLAMKSRMSATLGQAVKLRNFKALEIVLRQYLCPFRTAQATAQILFRCDNA